MTELLSAELTTSLSSGESAINLVFRNGETWRTESYSIPSADERYEEVLRLLQSKADGDTVFDVVSSEGAIHSFDERLREVVGPRFNFDFDAAVITYDGELIDNQIAVQILRLARLPKSETTDRHLKALVRFVENLYKNQSEFVRSQLFGWLTYTQTFESGFTITEDGCLLGYKGCAWGEDEDGEKFPQSINSGHAFADGVEYHGVIPNRIGSVVSMPRAEVTDDPAIGCSSGLHVGTHAYAEGWAKGCLLLVKVNPRDIVSVPTECEAQKIRCSRYEVLEMTEVEYTEPVYLYDEEWYDEVEDDEDDDWM